MAGNKADCLRKENKQKNQAVQIEKEERKVNQLQSKRVRTMNSRLTWDDWSGGGAGSEPGS